MVDYPQYAEQYAGYNTQSTQSGSLGSANMGYAAQAPKVESDVQSRLVSLAKAVEEMNIVTLQLRDRLTLVLRPIPPAPATESAGIAVNMPPCQLSQMVDEQTVRVYHVTIQINEILGRLQV